MYKSLGLELDLGYQPEVKTATGESMGALDQVTCTFKINSTPFTQAFIVCRQFILETDFTATNFVDVLWTKEGM